MSKGKPVCLPSQCMFDCPIVSFEVGLGGGSPGRSQKIAVGVAFGGPTFQAVAGANLPPVAVGLANGAGQDGDSGIGV